MKVEAIKNTIEEAIKKYATAASSSAYNLVPDSLTSGKLYEAHILSLVLERLHDDEGLSIVLVNDAFISLKSAPGPINSKYPHFKLYRGTSHFADLWTDVEFLSLSYSRRDSVLHPSAGDYHELDIVVVEPNATNRPTTIQIYLGVECKNTDYKKTLLKEILGIRRELSLLDRLNATRFETWPRQAIPANPPSCLLVYSSDSDVLNYAQPGEFFGIDFFHEPI